jgi:DNA-binding NtrC family response regulator
MAEIVLTLADLETAVPLNAALEQAGFTTALVSAVDDARAAVRREHPDLIVLTGAVHEPPALDLIAYGRDLEIFSLALLESTDSDRPDRIERLGASEVMRKPAPAVEVVALCRRLIERRRLQQRIGIIGQSGTIHEVLVKIEQMAPVTTTVLIQGESGTGKELVAKALHDLSPRRGKPFIPVNCAALPDTLLESELFGHEKGAFTGAAERRLGRFELADGGTILLDEIGEIPASTQVKLLRVLESRTFFRVGGVQPIKVDVRVVASTNRALRESVALGEFREDLYYRLSVLNIYLAPLRERREDIPLLVRRFIREFASQHERPFRGITAEAMQRLVEAPWPGNVRQLRNLVESMVVLAPGSEIRASDIPSEVLEGAHTVLPVLASGGLRQPSSQELEFILRSLMDLRLQVEELRRRLDDRPSKVQVIEIPETSYTPLHEVVPEPAPADVLYRPGMTMADVEKATIQAALKESRGNRRQAAAKLGIGERTLYRKIKEFGLG